MLIHGLLLRHFYVLRLLHNSCTELRVQYLQSCVCERDGGLLRLLSHELEA